MTMQTLDISLGGLKLEANFDLGVGESLDLAILTNGTRIHCRGEKWVIGGIFILSAYLAYLLIFRG
jgi:hypothetical protein